MSNNSEGSNERAVKFIKSISKGILTGLILSLLSGFTLTYFITRSFISHYTNLIGFDSLKYYAITNESTIHSLTWSIGILVFSVIYTLCFAPIILRVFYHQNKHHFEKFRNDHTLLTIVLIFVVFSAFPLSALLFIQLKWVTELVFLTPILLSYPIYLVLYNENGGSSLSYEEIGYYLWGALSFTFLSSITFYPFYFLLTQIDFNGILGTSVSDNTLIGTLVFFWIIYCAMYSIRIIYNSIYQYVTDLVIASFVLIILFAFSPITVVLPTVERSGIKDSEPQLYKLSQENYNIHLKQHIQDFWISDTTPLLTSCPVNSEESKCHYLMSNQLIDNNIKNIYLNLMVIYRDDDHQIVCPPYHRISKVFSINTSTVEKEKTNSMCIYLPIDILEPTPLSESTVRGNKNYIVRQKDFE